MKKVAYLIIVLSLFSSLLFPCPSFAGESSETPEVSQHNIIDVTSENLSEETEPDHSEQISGSEIALEEGPANEDGATEFLVPDATMFTEEISQSEIDLICYFMGKTEAEITFCDIIYTLEDNPLYLLINFEEGYVIYFRPSMKILEYSPTDNSHPYSDTESERKYYPGPMLYLYEESGQIIETENDEVISNEQVQAAIEAERMMLDDSAISIAIPSSSHEEGSFIATSNYPYLDPDANISLEPVGNVPVEIQSAGFGDNQNDTCGFIASAILLSYYDSKVNSDFVDETQYPDYSNHLSESLHTELIDNYGIKTTLDGTIPSDDAFNMNYYLGNDSIRRKVGHHMEYSILMPGSAISVLDSGKPLSIYTLFDSVFNNHVMVAYGYKQMRNMQGGTDTYFKIHSGHHDKCTNRANGACTSTSIQNDIFVTGYFPGCSWLEQYDGHTHDFSTGSAIYSGKTFYKCTQCNLVNDEYSLNHNATLTNNVGTEYLSKFENGLHYRKYKATSSGKYNVIISRSSIEVAVYDGSGMAVPSTDSYLANGGKAVSYNLNASTTYLIRFIDLGAGTEYFSHRVCVAHSMAVDYQLIEGSTMHYSSAKSASDADWICFVAPYKGVYEIITIFDNKPLSVALYENPNSSSYLTLNYQQQDADRTITRILSAGVYYLKIHAYSSSDSGMPYRVIVNSLTSEEDYPDTRSVAEEIDIDTEVNGKINYSNDWDVFHFTVPHKGAYELTWESDEPLSFYINTSASSSNSSTLIDTLTNGTISRMMNGGDGLYITILKHVSSSDDYDVRDIPFTIKVTSLNTEDEYPDTRDTAEEININTEINGKINYSNDRDVFYITVPYKGAYELTWESEEPLSFYTASSTSGNSALIDTATSGVTYRMMNGGSKLYVTILKHVSNSSDYDVRDISYTIKITPLTTEDEYPNSRNNPEEIGLNMEVHGKINYSDDWDVFHLTIPYKGAYELTWESNEPLSFYVAGNITSSSTLLGTSESGNSFLIRDKNVHLYITVLKHSSNSGDYDVRDIPFTIKVTSLNTEDEYPDARDTAEEININTEINGKINYSNDRDAFHVTVPYTGMYELTWESNEPLSIYVATSYSATSTLNGPATSGNAVSKANKSQGLYIIVLKHLSDSGDVNIRDIPYKIKIVPISTEDDHGDAWSEASGMGGGASGIINYTGDVDWFTFTISGEGTFRILCLSDETTTLSISNQTKTLKTARSINPSFSITLGSGTYYLSVTASGYNRPYSVGISGV